MTAYLIAQVDVKDMEQYKKYMALTPAIVEAHGGKFIARGGNVVTLEGEEETRRVVLLEFPSMEQIEAFYNSADYQEAKTLRADAAVGTFIAVSGA